MITNEVPETVATEPAIELVGVGKSYGEHEVIERVDLAIEEGEFLVLLGPSGCGKSTLLKIIAGLEDATAGEVYIAGRLVNYTAPKHRDIAMVFQNYALYPHMTVAQNLAFPLKMRKHDRAEIGPRVEEVAGMLDISSLLQRYPEQLSGGQRQRVALGRAIVRDPVAFLMDEPLSNLDALLRVQMREELLALHRRVGKTTVYVTHDQVEAMTMASRVVVMRGGVVQQIGTPPEVYERPANTFVATFVGSPQMNLYSGAIEGGDGAAIFRTDGFSVPLAGQAPQGPATLGVRPSDVELTADDADGSLPGTVVLVEYVGTDLYVRVDVGEGQSIVARVPITDRPRDGARVHVRLRPEWIHLFGDDGERHQLHANQHEEAQRR